MEWSEIGYIALGIIATLIGSIILKILEARFNKLGKIKLYGIIVEYNDDYIEIKLEIENTTNDVAFIRQLRLFGLKDDNRYPLIQSTYSENTSTKEREYFADEGYYSFAIPAKSFAHYTITYMFDKKNSHKKFDNLECQYFNEAEKLIKLHIDQKMREWQLFKIKK